MAEVSAGTLFTDCRTSGLQPTRDVRLGTMSPTEH
jgi:hypothetical protein